MKLRMVGETGFEPATPWTQTKCATKLRYSPFLTSGGDKQCCLTTGANITHKFPVRQTFFGKRRLFGYFCAKLTIIPTISDNEPKIAVNYAAIQSFFNSNFIDKQGSLYACTAN
tara:strand:- start:412 stop:753 length:342 start_codon:yes stop_codon:yes gene_type:complete